MPKVIMNNVEYDGAVGERLVDVARRNAVHMGYMYDGAGAFLIESTACRVLRGAESLNPPTEVEQSWFQQSWLDAGHRLASEATITGSGTIEILSRAEELRRQTLAIFSPPEGTTAGENAGLLVNNMTRIVMNQLVRFPSNVLSATTLMTKPAPNASGNLFQDLQQMFNDGTRVVQTMLGGKPSEEKPALTDQQKKK